MSELQWSVVWHHFIGTSCIITDWMVVMWGVDSNDLLLTKSGDAVKQQFLKNCSEYLNLWSHNVFSDRNCHPSAFLIAANTTFARTSCIKQILLYVTRLHTRYTTSNDRTGSCRVSSKSTTNSRQTVVDNVWDCHVQLTVHSY